MEMSESIDQIATALCAAQAEIEHAERDRINPAFKSRYADLGAVIDACKPALGKHGLSFASIPEPSSDGTLALTTILMHTSGQWIRGTMVMPLAKNDPQGYGSCLTYARRYALAALVGVAPADDDANAATGQVPQQGSNRAPFRPPASPSPTTGQQRTQAAVERQEAPLPVSGASPNAPLSPDAFAELKHRVKRLWAESGRDERDLDGMRERFSAILETQVRLGAMTPLEWERVEQALQAEAKQRSLA